MQNHAVVIGRVADTVNRRHRADDDGVAPLEQRLGRRQPHLLDVLVDARILLDEQVARRHVRFGLVVIVVRDEVLDRVLGKEFAHLGIELRGERLVGRHDQRRTAHARDHVRHRVGLARAGYAQQRLEREPVLDAFRQRRDGLGLVAGRLERLMQPVQAAGERDDLRRDRGGLGLGRDLVHVGSENETEPYIVPR